MSCKKIAFINGKGGCSKTTSIFHIVGVLADRGDKILVIDFDKQRNTTDNFLSWEESDYTEGESKTVFDFMVGEADIKDVVKKSFIVGRNERTPKYRKIDVLPADIRLEDEKLLKNVDIKEKMASYIEENGYDWLIVDMPPSNKAVNKICFEQVVDYVITPCTSDRDSMSGYGDLIDIVKEARKVNENLHILGAFLGRYMPNCALDRYIKEQWQENFNELFIDVQIPLKADVREGIMYYRPISFYKLFSSSKSAYENLVKEIEKRIAER